MQSKIVAAWALLMLLGSGPAIGQIRVSPTPLNNPGVGGKTLDEWMKLMEDRDPSVREHAIRMIGQLGPTAKKAAPTLIRQIAPNANDLSPMTSAVIALGQIVPDDARHIKDAVQALNSLLNHDQLILRFQAATALGHIGAPSRTSVERLKPMIKQNMSWELRRAAAYALGKVGRDDSGMPDMLALKALVDGIDDPCKEVRVESLQGVINLGMPALPQHQLELRGLLEQRVRADKDKFASIWVRVALLRMDAGPQTDAYVNDIAKHLKSTDLTLASDAARAIGACGVIAKSKIPDLVESLKSSDITLTFWSAWALGRMGPEAKNALPNLTALLESADSNVKTAAQEAIKQITSAKG